GGLFYAKIPLSIARDTGKIKDKIDRPDGVDVVFANAGITASGGHPVRLYEEYLKKVKTPGPDGTFENLGYVIIDNDADLEKKWPMIMAGAPDFIKGHLLYSEEFEKRRDDPSYYGHRGLDPKVLRHLVSSLPRHSQLARRSQEAVWRPPRGRGDLRAVRAAGRAQARVRAQA